MNIQVADHAGFCFGVREIDHKASDALARANGRSVYSYGPLVHNAQYVDRREKEGIHVLHSLNEAKQLDEQSILLLRAHGVTVEERKQLEATGAEIVDGTCPVLLNIYLLLQKKQEEGYRCVIVGDPNHPEVIAMRSRLDEDALVLSSPQEAASMRSKKPLFVVSQTTNREDYFEDVIAAIPKEVKITVQKTICRATEERQKACAKLAREVDLMIVIGGKHSSNTDKLRQVAEKETKNVQQIEVFNDFALQNHPILNRIGITAGASTPDWIIEEVVRGMENFTKEDFMEQIEDSMVKIYPRDIVKGTVISVKDDEVYVDIRYRADGIIKTDEMTDEERGNTHEHFHEGEEIDVYVIKLDDGEGNVMLSTRRVEGLKNWTKLMEKYEAGETVEALITGDNNGGLVANVMGINGFIPASQIATYFVKNFKQYIGQTLECKFLSVDERKRRVVLSARAVLEEQLDSVWEKIVVGETIKGKVVRMTDFGAFIDLGGVDGLIHVSDISWQRIEKPSDVLEIGQEVEPIVLKANRDRNRISLGLKQLMPKPFEIFKQNHKPGDVLKGTVVNLLDFGAFVRLDDGVEGLIHVSQIAHHHVEKPSDEYNIGQELDVKILEIDEERQRIALSTRALEEPTVEAKQDGEGEEKKAEPRHIDASKFERREAAPKAKQPKQPRERRKPQATLDFDQSDDIGTNLGDLIAAQMNLVDESPIADEEEPKEKAPEKAQIGDLLHESVEEKPEEQPEE
ncbi:bifunctional 4-hydroxy-3-methylbut-2-enyl diphosphate reductase/30S ribosomal protein S1 [Murdochiella massiliensis]|uniref:bifunctional 4-hydroxy-3-methylbut-2-enyl diphosphate reductase/30S ribosomal protein S1 n=1 Tax=Murdochiella massiliensis TaxID=1673723 RepID=UPI00096AD442|nr:bifunctional 4-hydroxy-3-methylbut-2-enyl diphosphate reductase/30S ribosomal protein S1 [Murdochiella massiliensis]